MAYILLQYNTDAVPCEVELLTSHNKKATDSI